MAGFAYLYERLGDVWSSSDGTNWTQATAEAPWSARGQPSGVVYNGKMWIFGGFDASANKNDVWCSTDGSNWTCVTTAAPWVARRGHSSLVYDGKMWIMGGYGSGGLKNDVWWSTDGTNWSEATSSAEWSPRQYIGVAAYNGVMWVTGGGSDGTWEANDVWFSKNGNTWVRDTEHAPWVSRYGHGLLVYKDRMWLAGGADVNTGQRLNDVWYSDIVPAPPLDIQADDGEYTNKVTITWNSSTGATKYVVYRSTTDSTNSALDISGEITEISFDDITANLCEIYYYWVKAGSYLGWSDFSVSDSGYKRLSVSTGVSASDGDYTDKVVVTWNSSTGATKYVVYRNTTDSTNNASDISGEITGTSFDDTTANSCQKYYYWIKAGCDNGWSDFSVSDSGYERLSVSTGVSASDGDFTNKVTITWNISTGATKYKIYRNTIDNSSSSLDISGEISVTSFDDTNAKPGATYYYWIKAGCDNGWSDFSISESGYKQLSIPANISATDGIYDDKVIITWSNVPYALAYNIYRSELNIASNATLLGSLVTNNIYTDITVVPGKKYFYWIEATADVGNSDLSERDPGFAFVSQDEAGTEGKWKYKSKNGKAKLIIKDMGMETPLANYLEDGCLIGLKDSSNNETVDGPRILEPKKKKNGDVKFWFYNKKKVAIIKYKPKNDKLIYKVWQNLPAEIIFFVQPPEEAMQNTCESNNALEPVIEIHLQPGAKEVNGWKQLKPVINKNN